MAITPVQSFKLVVPLGHKPTAMRTTDTAGSSQAASGAVSQLIGESLRQSDIDSTMGTPLTPGIRTSTTVTRTTTTRALPSAPARSAVQAERHHADFSFVELVQAYLDCRKAKRNTPSALAFEVDQERNLARLADELRDGSYRPGRSICFVVTRPKAREVWAAKARIETFLAEHLHLRLNPSKTILQPVERGVDFAGQVIKPWCRRIRRRTVNTAIQRIGEIPAADLFASGNSYFGLMRQADGHQDQARLANALRRRGHSIKSDLTKTYRTKRSNFQKTRSDHE